MTKPWAEVAGSPAFQQLAPPDQEAARQQYFQQVVAPRLGPDDLEAARAQFDGATRAAQPPAAPAPSVADSVVSTIKSAASSVADAASGVAGWLKPAIAGLAHSSEASDSPLATSTLPEPAPAPYKPSHADMIDAASAGGMPVGPPAPVTKPVIPHTEAVAVDQGAARRRYWDDVPQGTVRAGYNAAAGQAGKTLANLMSTAGEVTDTEGLRTLGRQYQAAADARINRAMQGNEDSDAVKTVAGVFSLAPLVAGPAGLGAMVTQAGVDGYSDARQAGDSPGEAVSRGTAMALANYVGLRTQLPGLTGALTKAVSGAPAGEAIAALGHALTTNVGGMEATTVLGDLYDKMAPGGMKPNMSADDMLHDIAATAKSATLLTLAVPGVPLAAGHLFHAAHSLAHGDGSAAAARAIDSATPPPADATPTTAADNTAPAPIGLDTLHDSIDETAKAVGLSPAATVALREAAAQRDPQDAAAFVARAFHRYEANGLTTKPGAPGAFRDALAQRIADQQPEPAPAAPAKKASAAPSVADQFAAIRPLDTAPAADAAPADQAAPPAEPTPITPEGMAKANDIAAAAHDAATSPFNDHPEPTDAQKAAGNYRVGRVQLHGLDISIENPQGSTRSGVDPDGKPWANEMQAHYGYIRGSRAGDGDAVDTFIGPNPESKTAYVIDQVDPSTGKFDEPKTILGADSEQQARELYAANYADGWNGLGAITALPMDAFKAWVRDGVKSKPLGDISTWKATDERAQPDMAEPTGVPPGAGDGGSGPAVAGGRDLAQDAPVASGRGVGGDAAAPAAGAGKAAAVDAGGGADAALSFKTAKGSTYLVHPDGTTTRDKAARDAPGHEGDSGVKARSIRTVYLDEPPPSAAGVANIQNPRIAIKGDKLTLVSKSEGGAWGASPSQRDLSFHNEPAVGRFPLELWQPRGDVSGHEAYAGMHAGNKITEIGKPDAPRLLGKPVTEYETPALQRIAGMKATSARAREVASAEIARRAAQPAAAEPSAAAPQPQPDEALTKQGADTPRAGIDPAALRSEVTRIQSGWKDAPPVHVVDDVAGLPAHIQDSLRSMGAEGKTRALLMPGKGSDPGDVYLIASRLKDIPTAQQALFHEVLGHYGIRKVLGSDATYFAEMYKLRQANPALASEAEAWMQAHGRGAIADRMSRGLTQDQAMKVVRALSTEEALADRAGKGEPIRGLQSLMAKIQTWLRSVGLDHVADHLEKMTQAETAALLARARRAVETQEPGAQHAGELAPALHTGEDPEEKALQTISAHDDMFALPKSDKTSIKDITAENDPSIKFVRETKVGVETMYRLEMPDGAPAFITVRKPGKYGPSVYGHESDGAMGDTPITERPGRNPEDVDPDKEDVYIDVSHLKSGSDGATVYNIAATFAHNTGRIFIGDPAGVSDMAMRRRPQHMLSSALKFGTTEHLAPHPDQVSGRGGVPPLDWVYGDHVGNVRRLVDHAVKSIENDFPASKDITYDPATGKFRNATSGREADLAGLGKLLPRRGGGVDGRSVAGSRTIARAAVWRALLRGEGGQGEGAGQRDDLLARLGEWAPQLSHPDMASRIFLSQAGDRAEHADAGGTGVAKGAQAETRRFRTSGLREGAGSGDGDTRGNRNAAAGRDQEERARARTLREGDSPLLSQHAADDAAAEPDAPRSHVADALAKVREAGAKFADTMKAIRDDALLKTVPMALGNDQTRTVAKDFANASRLAAWQWGKFDDVLTKNYDEAQRRDMFNASDEQSVLLQQGKKVGPDEGLNSLTPDERKTVETLQGYGDGLLERAKGAGMFEGEGIPSWTPRMAVMVDGRGGFSRPKGTGAETGAKQGRNIVTTASSLKARKYLTSAETEAAMKGKLGDGAQLVRDIRVMPLAMARLEKAIAGRELLNQIKAMGDRAGLETVSTSDKDGFFTVDHPAFKTWQATTAEDGTKSWEAKPLYVNKAFEGPLKAVMSETPGPVYSALMALKAKSMGLIMYSPLIHNAVEWGRALPAMPGKVATFRIYFEGNRIKNDPVQMRQAISDGLVPIGKRGGIQDITGIMEDPSLKPGRSWTAKLIGGALGLANEKAGTAVKKGIDAAGDFWHNTLLWDRVGDLQAGLYGAMREKEIAKGVDPAVAGKLAAHFANRFAGALPNEAMSAGARKVANLLMFSRTFTLGNMGLMKDMLTGLPRDVQSQIRTASGDLAAKAAVSRARRIAIASFIVDIGLMYVGNSLMQDAFKKMRGDKTLGELGQGYLDHLHKLMQRTGDHPLATLSNPFDMANSLSSTSENEPGKEDRIRVGTQDDGTAIYMRLPTGKVGEDFKNWITKPLITAKAKESQLVRPLQQIWNNDNGIGRRIYDPDAEGLGGVLSNAGKIAKVFATQMIPADAIQGAVDWKTGKASDVDKLKVVGPLAGLTFSKGAPGGPAVGEMYAADRKFQGAKMDVMPDVKAAVKDGDLEKAVALLEGIKMAPGEIRATLRHLEVPESRLSAGAFKRFSQHASDEDMARMMQLLQGEQPAASAAAQ